MKATDEKTPQNTTYLTALSDRIANERPSSEILYNTFLDIFRTGFDRGYAKRLEDGAKLRRGRKDRQKASWNSVKDNISDLCSKQVVINNEQDN
jgi:hypothetical protein